MRAIPRMVVAVVALAMVGYLLNADAVPVSLMKKLRTLDGTRVRTWPTFKTGEKESFKFHYLGDTTSAALFYLDTEASKEGKFLTNTKSDSGVLQLSKLQSAFDAIWSEGDGPKTSHATAKEYLIASSGIKATTSYKLWRQIADSKSTFVVHFGVMLAYIQVNDGTDNHAVFFATGYTNSGKGNKALHTEKQCVDGLLKFLTLLTATSNKVLSSSSETLKVTEVKIAWVLQKNPCTRDQNCQGLLQGLVIDKAIAGGTNDITPTQHINYFYDGAPTPEDTAWSRVTFF